MRTTLFVSTLFAMSLCGNVALAEKPHRPIREPRAVEFLRQKGDVVDKTYRGRADNTARTTRDTIVRESRNPLRNPGQDRVNCSDTGGDCSSHRARTERVARSTASSPASQPAMGMKSPVERHVEKRANCGDVDGCSASSGASKSAWSRAKSGSSPVTQGTLAGKAPRLQAQPADARMACNEGEECSFSSKEAKKIWAYAAVKAGTWTGPAADTARVTDKARDAKAKASKATATKSVND